MQMIRHYDEFIETRTWIIPGDSMPLPLNGITSGIDMHDTGQDVPEKRLALEAADGDEIIPCTSVII